MSSLSREDVDRLAALAHLQLDASEAERLAAQLDRFLAYAQQLRVVDTTGVPPTTHVLTPEAALRDDEPRKGLSRELALQNAPDAACAAGLFKVPRVIGG